MLQFPKNHTNIHNSHKTKKQKCFFSCDAETQPFGLRVPRAPFGAGPGVGALFTTPCYRHCTDIQNILLNNNYCE